MANSPTDLGQQETVLDVASLSESAQRRSCTVLLVGKAGNGKSQLGNALLNGTAGLGHASQICPPNERFAAHCSLAGVTQHCQLRRAAISGANLDRWDNLTVIDTPGLCREGVDNSDVIKEIEGGIDLATGEGADELQGGVDAILIVMNLGACISAEELRALDAVRDRLGHRSFQRRGVVVFTHMDRLQEDGIAIKDHLSSAPTALKQLLAEVGTRSVALNACERDPAQCQRNRVEIFAAVQQIVEQQGAAPYTGADKPKQMRMKQARRLRQQAERERENERRREAGSQSWFDWIFELIAPSPVTATMDSSA